MLHGEGHEAMVKLLLEKDAELETKDKMVGRRCHTLLSIGTRRW
jgi:hypothetical protein